MNAIFRAVHADLFYISPKEHRSFYALRHILSTKMGQLRTARDPGTLGVQISAATLAAWHVCAIAYATNCDPM